MVQYVDMLNNKDISNGKVEIFRLDSMNMLTKLRPFVRTFLKEASKLFEMDIYTMGKRSYALQMAKSLDPGCLLPFCHCTRGLHSEISKGSWCGTGERKCCTDSWWYRRGTRLYHQLVLLWAWTLNCRFLSPCLVLLVHLSLWRTFVPVCGYPLVTGFATFICWFSEIY